MAVEYDVHPSVEHALAILGNLAEKTGRSPTASGLTEPAEIDEEVERWLRVAYELDG